MIRIFFRLGWLAFFCFFILIPKGQAKLFKNSYVSFELPNSWDCHLQNKAWTCRYAPSKSCQSSSADPKNCYDEVKKAKEAIFILTAKAVGPRDTFNSYQTHLKKSRPITTKNGKSSASKLIHLKNVKIKGLRWIDGMQLGSEIPHYYTRYLATIHGKVAVLVTLSAHKRYYTKYSSAFFKTIKSLKVLTDTPKVLERRDQDPGQKGLLGHLQSIDVENLINGENSANLNESKSKDWTARLLLIGAFFLALAAFILWLRGRNSI